MLTSNVTTVDRICILFYLVSQLFVHPEALRRHSSSIAAHSRAHSISKGYPRCVFFYDFPFFFWDTYKNRDALDDDVLMILRLAQQRLADTTKRARARPRQ